MVPVKDKGLYQCSRAHAIHLQIVYSISQMQKACRYFLFGLGSYSAADSARLACASPAYLTFVATKEFESCRPVI